jgi:selenide,water dikinase
LGVPDDAAVYRLDDQRALIFTTDFFTPIVDDPYQYGAIAAANALSDVYAMGGQPLLALNIAAFPTDLPQGIIVGVMRGAAATVKQANAVIAGGHTIQDKEPKFGLAVVGLAHPDKLLTKDGARPGDILVLTKPLGTGSITTAAKNDRVRPEHLVEAVEWMRRLNRAASESAVAAGARAATDITGFGLLGHASEVADSSEVTFLIHAPAVPLMSGVSEYADQWIFPGGSSNNFRTFGPLALFEDGINEEQKMILADAQTSGGLLISLSPDRLDRFSDEMVRRDAPWWRIGEVVERRERGLIVTR